jgi:hypothetical protein
LFADLAARLLQTQTPGVSRAPSIIESAETKHLFPKQDMLYALRLSRPVPNPNQPRSQMVSLTPIRPVQAPVPPVPSWDYTPK